MSFDPTAAAKHASARLRPLGRLGERHFPKRVREAIAEIHSATADGMRELAIHALKEFDQAMFRQAEQARNNTEQARCFDAIRLVRQGEGAIVDRLLARVESDLAAAPWSLERPSTALDAGGSGDLSLVDEHVLDEELALEEMASRATIRFSEPLHLLGQRFGVLVAAPALEPEQLPVGPDSLASALGEAISTAGLALEPRLQLIRILERLLLARLGLLYGKLNTIFVARRILPNLGLAVRRAPGGGPSSADTTKPATAPATSPEAATGPASAPSAAPIPTTPSGHARPVPPVESPRFHGAVSGVVPAAKSDLGARHAGSAPAASPAPATSSFDVESFAGPSAPTPEFLAELSRDLARFPGLAGLMRPVIGFPELPSATSAGDPAEELRLLDTLLDLLAQRRRALGQQVPAGPGPGVTPESIKLALANLQRQRHAGRHTAGTTRSGIEALREDLLAQLRAFTPPGQTPQLGAAEQDAIDLLAMLFDELSKEHRDAQPVRDLLARLEVPLLRVALRDRSFFSSPTHPARRLLNAISASGRFWVDEHGEDTLLFTRLRAMVDRITRDYDEDLGVFDDLLEDLQGFLGTLARKSEVAEKRHVETARGRERLELARRSANTAIANLLEGRETAAIARTLLEQTWTDVLALTILKHGNDPVELERVLSIANRLVDALDPHRPPLDDLALARLKTDLVAGLGQVGYHEEDAKLIAERLFDADSSGRDGQPVSITEIAIKLKSRTRLGADADASSPPARSGAPATDGQSKETERAAPPPLTEAEAAVRRHLEQTRFGTWFEFLLPGGRRTRRKLAWFSPVSGRCLFVNARGARADEMTLDDLARRIAIGDVSVVEAEPEGDVERAWKRIANSLKRMVGILPARPATA